jgi:spore coat protein CotH
MTIQRFATPIVLVAVCRNALTALLVLAVAASSAEAQTSADLFAPGTLHDIRLFMNSQDLQQLRETYQENTYYQADLEWRGMRVRSIAIRSRGLGSRNATKPGLRIDFDRFATGQRFLGLESLVLDNLWQDPSLVRESVTMALFTRLGQPAPREAYARLFINDVYQGVYGVVEAIDPAFLERAFGDPGGYVFEYRWQDEFHAEYRGRSLDRYKALFAPESHQLDADSSLYVPLHDLFREINAPASATWLESVERYLDVRGFLTHVAVETFVSEWDGVLGAWAMNNFYVYRPAESTRHVFIPWDRDYAFQAVDSSVMLRAEDNVLVKRLLEHPDLRAYYLEVLETCAGMANGWLDQEIVARANLIRDAAYADPGKNSTNEEFEAGIAFLRMFASNRSAFVLAEIARLRTQP